MKLIKKPTGLQKKRYKLIKTKGFVMTRKQVEEESRKQERLAKNWAEMMRKINTGDIPE